MKNKIVIAAAILIAGFVLFQSFYTGNRDKTAYINLNKVFQEFELKKSLQEKLLQTQEARKKVLDSLEFNLRLLSEQIQEEKGKDQEHLRTFKLRSEEYQNKRKEMEEDNAVMGQKYDEQIFTQLNQYVEDYGKEKGYTYIYGANSTGVLMYAKKDRDITEEVIEFINQKYSGN